MTSSMMSWMMHGEDSKVKEGQVLKEINQVRVIDGSMTDQRSGTVACTGPLRTLQLLRLEVQLVTPLSID